MEQKITEIAARCFKRILSDEPWQDFGFSKRPKHGSLVDKLRPAWKVKLEKIVLQEMLILLTTGYIAGEALSKDDLAGVTNRYASTPELAQALGYSTPEEALAHLNSSINEYLSHTRDEWSALLLAHINPSSIPDRKMAARLIIGCIRFVDTIGAMIDITKRQNPLQK